jgi:hypothetical protein
MSKKVVAKAKAKAKTAPTKPATKADRFSGRRIALVGKLDDLRRQPGSSRYASLEIIAKANGKGLAVDDYVEKGGVRRYLAWFEKRGQIKVA